MVPVFGELQARPAAQLAAQQPPRPSYPQQNYGPPSPVLVVASHPPEPRLNTGGWFLRSFASTTGVLLALGMFLVLGMMTACGGVVYVWANGVTASIEERERREVAARAQQITRPPQAASTGQPAPSTPAAVQGQAVPEPQPTKEPDRASFPAALRKGAVEVVPVSVSVGPIAFIERIGDAKGESDSDYFSLKLTVRNTSKTKRVDFRGWPGENSFLSNMRLTDEHGNRYKAMDFGFTVEVDGDESGETIEPESERTAIVVCEPPIAAANELLIDLEGSAVGLDETTSNGESSGRTGAGKISRKIFFARCSFLKST